MRRFASPLVLLFMLYHGTASAQTQPPARASDYAFPAANEETEQLRAAARKLLAEGSLDNDTKAAELLDKAAQIDVHDAERRKLEQPSADPIWKDLVPNLLTFASIIILAGTLIFNVRQAQISEREKRESDDRQRDRDEQKRFDDALQLLQKSEDFSPAATLISTFTIEPFRSKARKAGIAILRRSKTIDSFRDLFNSVMDPVTHETLPQVIELLRAVQVEVQPLLYQTWNGTTNDLTKLRPTEVERYNLLTDERTFLGAQVAAVLRRPRQNPASALDISKLGFDGPDLSGANLRNAVISPAVWNLVNLDGCDVRGIDNFHDCWFYATAWWHVAYIDKPFLEFLKSNFPYTEGQQANSPKPISKETYRDDISRLEALAQ